jgi:hypothetical protein
VPVTGTRRTLVVKVDNTVMARPQAGIEDADVVYVEPVEGGLTRLAAVFSSHLPALVGPIRSARISDIELFAQYGRPGFAYSGAQHKLLPQLHAASLDEVSPDTDPRLFTRSATRPAPYDLFASGPELLRAASSASSTPDVGLDPGAAPTGGRRTGTVRATWQSASATFTWSGSSHRWLWTMDGRAMTTLGGKRLSTPTVLVQYVRVTASGFKDFRGAVTPMAHTVGTGTGVLLRDGRSWPVRWSRPSATAGTSWTTPAGDPAHVARGPVWVLLVDRGRPAGLSR